MLREGFRTWREFRRASLRHKPPEELLVDGGAYVRVDLMLADDTTDLVHSIYDQAPSYKSFVLGRMASVAIGLVGMSFIGNGNGLRTYLVAVAKDRPAAELPPPPVEGAEDIERDNSVALKLEPGAWSLARVLEDDMGLSMDSVLRYGFAIMQAARTHPEYNLAFVDRFGETAEITHNAPLDIDLSGPPELI